MRQTDLGRYAGWTDRERIVGNLHRAMAELDGAWGVGDNAPQVRPLIIDRIGQ